MIDKNFFEQTSLTDFAKRQLSEKEEIRIATCAQVAVEIIEAELNKGHQPREDFLNSSDDSDRSDAEEIFEGMLFKCKNEHEEKKIKLIASIFAKTSFMSNVSLGEANFDLILAEKLSYRQFCVLVLIKRKDELNLKLRSETYANREISIPFEEATLLHEVFSMLRDGLIHHAGGIPTNAFAGAPCNWTLTPVGSRFTTLCSLEQISDEDIRLLSQFLS